MFRRRPLTLPIHSMIIPLMEKRKKKKIIIRIEFIKNFFLCFIISTVDALENGRSNDIQIDHGVKNSKKKKITKKKLLITIGITLVWNSYNFP